MWDEAWKGINVPSSRLASPCSQALCLVSKTLLQVLGFSGVPEGKASLKAWPSTPHPSSEAGPAAAYAPLQKVSWTATGGAKLPA